MITVYTLCYNESHIIKYAIEHYKTMFPTCKFVIYDNCSTDNSVQIAKTNGAEVFVFDTNNRFNDTKHIEIKNNCWKESTTDWVLICDLDELLNINEDQLKYEQSLGSTVIKSEGYHMINMEDNLDLHNMKYGVRAPLHDKNYLFNKKFISDTNYEAGCHKSNLIGNIQYSSSAYKAYHYHFVNEKKTIEKYKLYAKRLSQENLDNKWGYHYLFSEQEVHDMYANMRRDAVKIIS